jgi:hypothetical protein
MTKVDFILCERDGKFGAECSACGEFFTDDKGRKGNNGMTKAIAHAKEKHKSEGGTVGAPPMSTLWSAKVSGVGSRARQEEEILFRERDDWEAAASTAQKLLDASPACKMIGGVIVQVKRVAHLWN